MKIAIDLLGAQSDNAKRGIGRYTLAMTKSLIEYSGDHDIFIILNGELGSNLQDLIGQFSGVLPRSHIKIWYPPAVQPKDTNIAEDIRLAFIDSLKVDLLVISSFMEGFSDNMAVVSVSKNSRTPTAVILYDLIPYIFAKEYLVNPDMKKWYMQKFDQLKNADLFLAISGSAAFECEKYLLQPKSKICNVSSAADNIFKPTGITEIDLGLFNTKYGISKPYVMYTGGIDFRKNIEGLIEGFSLIPADFRKKYQLIVVCAIQKGEKECLTKLVRSVGLEKNDVIFTGFVPEMDLLTFYNQCELFVFPSLHEGFGLPILEAMQCGKAVIAANNSSLPEVVGVKEALFDTQSNQSIADKILEVLTDAKFKQRLEEHALTHSLKFSWDRTAKKAWSFIVDWHQSYKQVNRPTKKSKGDLAFISPLPPVKSGISDYSSELIPYLSQYYNIDIVMTKDHTTDVWITKNCKVRSVEFFRKNYALYDRVLYHIGNSEFHEHMFELMLACPGVVVLHDFFLSGIHHYSESNQWRSGAFLQAIFQSHGYKGIKDYISNRDECVWKYPANFAVLQNARGIIVHSPSTLNLMEQWYGKLLTSHFKVIPHLREPAAKMVYNKERLKIKMGFSKNDFIICSFGILGTTKLNHRLLESLSNSQLITKENVYVVFAGHCDDVYKQRLLKLIQAYPSFKNRIKVTGWISKKTFADYLQITDIAVQLRCLTRGETSGTVLDCMNYGLATVVNANGSMADINPDAVIKLPDQFSNAELMEAIESLYNNKEQRTQIGHIARKVIEKQHAPKLCAELYYNSIEYFYSVTMGSDIIQSIAKQGLYDDNIKLVQSVNKSFPPSLRKKQILLDISELVQRNAATGVQRVVIKLIGELIDLELPGCKIEPIYTTPGAENYYYARDFMCNMLGCVNVPLYDEKIDVFEDDILFILDLQPHILIEHERTLQAYRAQKAKVIVMMYDLLPVTNSDKFLSGAHELYSNWLKVVSKFDGVVAISNSVVKEYCKWLEVNRVHTEKNFSINSFCLGANIAENFAKVEFTVTANDTLDQTKNELNFLMVGTLEPRKGHLQVIEAFEELWRSDYDINLTIVGKQGWLVDELITKIKTHPELNHRLFWLQQINDEYLEQLYTSSSCLIAASIAEGFGLPLIEAAQHNLPIFARDIPVFREVAGEHCYYFENSNDPSTLAASIEDWLLLYSNENHPRSDNMPFMTWEESARELLGVLLEKSEVRG